MPNQKPEAHARFQEIAFAYAVLSSPKRRSRYDVTGSTSDSIHLDDDDDFNWLDFFRSQYKEHVTSGHINSFRARYQGSEEEKRDVLVAYTAHKGSMLKVFHAIMLSNPLEDEARFRGYIDEAIKEGRVEEHKAYTKETAKSKNKRLKAAGKEARLAEEHAKLLGLKIDDVEEVGRKGAPMPAQEDLAALIQQRQKGRAEGFLEGLEAKYAKKEAEKRAKGKGKKRKVEEEMPDEEAFQAAAKRLKKGQGRDEGGAAGEATNGKTRGLKKSKAKTPNNDNDDKDDDEQSESDGESLGSDSSEEKDDDEEIEHEASASSSSRPRGSGFTSDPGAPRRHGYRPCNSLFASKPSYHKHPPA